jgi:4-amino-4-deoxy-L-arabinose transferase-like glycosyltransferase
VRRSGARGRGGHCRLAGVRASRDVRWALGLAVLALALRLALVLTAGRTDVFNEHAVGFAFNDTLFYRGVGEAIAHGDGFSFLGYPTAHWPPGYPAALAAVFTVFGVSSKGALVFNAVVGAVTVPLVYLVALRAFGRSAAILAAAVLAILPGQILMGDVILAETLYTFELVGFFALVAVLDRRLWSLAVLGVVAGLAALTRGEGLLFPLIVLAAGAGRGTWRTALRQTAVVALVMVLVVAPWTIRNGHVAHAFVPVSTNATSSLWQGHNPHASGEAMTGLVAAPARLKGARGEAESARVLRRRAIDWAVHHPGRELELIPLKLEALLRSDSNVIALWIDAPGQRPLGHPADEVARWAANATWAALFVVFVGAVVLFGRSLWANRLVRAMLVFIALALPLYGFVYFGGWRYRMPLEPLMIVVAAGGAVMARERWRARVARSSAAA